MTKVNPKNGIETKSDISPWDIFKYDSIFICSQNTKKIQKLLYIGIFQFCCKSEHKQVK